ncbi:hypothetical protein [Rhizobium laguerreae]|uniref:hypothetical protein n=1 Tax=Rhizobium laguerreae TaxID=1076926 RepID=UPI0014417CFC|nr:hypothetical protein [Rhizobium laguerreae]NKM36347.1 hypothetical protein [Rhizobium laguerreae]
MSFIRKGEEGMLEAVEGRVRWRARVHYLWVAAINPVVPWHRLSEHLLRDIGKSAADAELEAYIGSFGSFRRFRSADRE